MNPFKRIFLFLFVTFIIAISCGLWWISNNYVVPILMYHQVDYASPKKPDTVSPELFEHHLALLSEHNYNVISMDEFVEATLNQERFPRNTIVITFDDGYENNYTYAFPVLKMYDMPAIIFMPSHQIGNEGQLNLEQLKEMINESKITIGSHTRFQKYLPSISGQELEDEIFLSKEKLEEVLGVPIKHFAYPIGGFTPEAKKLVQKAGYLSASTTNRGVDPSNQDIFELNRVRMSDNDTNDFVTRIKFSGYYNVFRKLKKPY
ncbi:MAG: polysaccharide deacetylase family protein [Candidatus Omnitrophica bacterium]|nr:polysaccharide deacetylase family protein [Candidatus Omnitrophota bacterium]